tara:strand:+ start:135 stop:308 length:174 start_codon:yes stop_codon:yes gene_type:complete
VHQVHVHLHLHAKKGVLVKVKLASQVVKNLVVLLNKKKNVVRIALNLVVQNKINFKG